ncbi:MAG: hypothetical protein QW568_00635 [Candidatus Anstonellaceae archaeon]
MATAAFQEAKIASASRVKAAPAKPLSQTELLKVEEIRKDIRSCVVRLPGLKIPKSVKKRVAHLSRSAKERLWEKLNIDTSAIFFRKLSELHRENAGLSVELNSETNDVKLISLNLDSSKAEKTVAVSKGMVLEMSTVQNLFFSMHLDKKKYSTHDKAGVAQTIHFAAQVLMKKSQK